MNNLEEMKEKMDELLDEHEDLMVSQMNDLIKSIQFYLDSFVIDKENEKYLKRLLKILQENEQ
jgi:outer membrane protein OmpA-like peptidoglycan-associated protein